MRTRGRREGNFISCSYGSGGLLAGLDQAAGTRNDGEALGREDLLGLRHGVGSPGADGVEADVGEPVTEGAAAVALALVGEGQVVVRVGVLRDEGDGALVGGNRVGQPLELVEHVAEVEEGERVLGVGLGGAAVELLGHGELAQVVVDGAEVDGGSGIPGAEREDFAIHLGGLGKGCGIFLQLHRALEHLLQIGLVDVGADDVLSWRSGAESKSKASCWVRGSTSAPQWRKARRREPCPTALASISGLPMPAALLMASTDSRLLLAEIRVARNARRVRSWARSSNV